MVSTTTSLQGEMDVLVNLVGNLLQNLEENISPERLKELLRFSKRLSRFEQKVMSTRNVLTEILENGILHRLDN